MADGVSPPAWVLMSVQRSPSPLAKYSVRPAGKSPPLIRPSLVTATWLRRCGRRGCIADANSNLAAIPNVEVVATTISQRAGLPELPRGADGTTSAKPSPLEADSAFSQASTSEDSAYTPERLPGIR